MFSVHNVNVTQCVAVRTQRYIPSEYNFLCTFSVQNNTVTQNGFWSENTVSVKIQFMYLHCEQCYCNTQCFAFRKHICRPSQYNLLCTFGKHNVTVTQNVADRTQRYRPSKYNYLCTFSVHNFTIKHKNYSCQNTPLKTVTVHF